MHGIRKFHAEIASRDYRFAKPGLDDEPWGLTVDVTDPFGNQLRFCEQAADATELLIAQGLEPAQNIVHAWP